MAIQQPKKIVILSYDIKDDYIALSEEGATLCNALCEKFGQNFAVGIEKLPFSMDLEEQVKGIDTRINKITTLIHSWGLAWEDLIQAESTHSKAFSIKEAKPLIQLAKTLVFQRAILTTLQKTDDASFFGLNDKPNAEHIMDFLLENNIEWAVLFIKNTLVGPLTHALSALKAGVQSFLLHSAHYNVSEEQQETLKQERITPINATKISLPSSRISFIQQVSKSLDDQTRLLTSMRAMSKSSMPKESNSATFSHLSSFSHSSPLGSDMKNALRGLRSVLNEDDDAEGPSTITIVGSRNHDSDE